MTFQQFISNPNFRLYKDNIDYCFQAVLGKKYLRWRNTIKNKIKYFKLSRMEIVDWHTAPAEKIYWHYDLPVSQPAPMITAIVVFTGDQSALQLQMETVNAQHYCHQELIILTDSSLHQSQIQNQIEALGYPFPFRVVPCPKLLHLSLAACWSKGIEAAHGQLLWFPQAGSSYRPDFLEKMSALFACQSTLLALCIPEAREIFPKTFFVSAPVFEERFLDQIDLLTAAKNMVIRNPRTVPEWLIACSEKTQRDRSLSEWLFFLWLIQGGCVGCITECLVSPQKKPEQDENSVSKNTFKPILDEFLCWRKTVPSVLMCCSDFMLGGGETFAIHLANELHRQGIIVTLIDFHLYKPERSIRRLLHPAIPVVKLSDLRDLGNVISQLKGEIIHSHHGNVDEAVSLVLQKADLNCRQFITLHGMYESMPEADCQYLLKQVSRTCCRFIYIADKNLQPFSPYWEGIHTKFTHIGNGLPPIIPKPMKRSRLGIPESAFVLCIASRGIPEKGWAEGIETVRQSRRKCGRDIHLLILGDGEMRPVLEADAPAYIHFTGAVSNVRDYFAMSDVGFLPSYFKGESFPLAVTEALMCGIPVIASDLGEVKNQLKDEHGDLAGVLIPVNHWKLDLEKAVETVSLWASDSEEYHKYRQRTFSAAKKMEISSVARKYIQLYQDKGAIEST